MVADCFNNNTVKRPSLCNLNSPDSVTLDTSNEIFYNAIELRDTDLSHQFFRSIA